MHIPSLYSSPGKMHPLPLNEGLAFNCKTEEVEMRAEWQTGLPPRGPRADFVLQTTRGPVSSRAALKILEILGLLGYLVPW